MVAVLKRSVSPPQKVFNPYGIYLRSAPARFFDGEPGTGYRSHDNVSMVNVFSCDNFVASLAKLVSSRPRDSSETFLLGKRVGNLAQSPVRTVLW